MQIVKDMNFIFSFYLVNFIRSFFCILGQCWQMRESISLVRREEDDSKYMNILNRRVKVKIEKEVNIVGFYFLYVII